MGTNNVAIQLRPESNSFIKEHKIFIMDQLGHDHIISGILGKITPTLEMYTVSASTLTEEKYSYKNLLIIKLEIYLNS